MVIPATASDIRHHRWHLAGMGQQTIRVVLQFENHLDPELLTQATALLIESEPILGCRLSLEIDPPAWLPSSKVVTPSLASEDLSLEAAVGPQIKLGLSQHAKGDRLTIAMTHEVADAAGARFLTEKLADIYTHLARDGSYKTAHRSPHRRDVSSPLRLVLPWRYPLLAGPLKLKMIFRNNSAPAAEPETSTGAVHGAYCQRHLNADQSRSLIAYGRKHDATLTELLLAAYHHALQKEGFWPGKPTSAVALDIDLRRWHAEAGIDEPVANLSSAEFLVLGDQARSFEETLARVSKTMSTKKRRGLGVAVAVMSHRSNASGGPKRASTAKLRAAVRNEPLFPWLTNMGALDGEKLCFAELMPVAAHLEPPAVMPPGLLVAVSSFGAKLTLSAGTSEEASAAVTALLDSVLAELRSAVEP